MGCPGLLTRLEHITELYERYVLEWDADRNSTPWHDRFITCLPRGARVLDLGCWAGMPVAHHLVQQGLHVTGVDSSPMLIALCQRRMPQQEWMVADMRTVSLQRRFDGMLRWDRFFHLTPADQRKMFDVFAAYAASGSVPALQYGSTTR